MTRSKVPWYFLSVAVIGYIITFLLSREKAAVTLIVFKEIMVMIIPIFLLIFLLMVLTNVFVKPKTLINHLGKDSGIKGWLIAVFAGILSSGPIYMWYPLLDDLQKKGMRTGLISTFLYNRAVKLPLIPLIISYFGIAYSVSLLVSMVLVSVIQGWTTEKILEVMK